MRNASLFNSLTFFFFQAEDGIRDRNVTGVQTCALPIFDEHRKPFQPSIWDRSASANGQVLEQVWFAGVHSNVGGSYPQSGLSDITLLWMISKVQACGLAVDRTCVQANSNPKPDPLGKLYDS